MSGALVTVNRSDLIAVFELAILTEDRDPSEQRALNRIAKALDESAPSTQRDRS